MKKITIIKIIGGFLVLAIVGGVLVVKRIKNVKNANIVDLPEEDFTDVTESEEETENVEEASEEVITETDEVEEEVVSVINKTETKEEKTSDIEDEEIEIDDDEVCNVAMDDVAEDTENLTMHTYIAWLIQNGVSTEEAQSVMETVSKIKNEMPEKYVEIEETMNTLMTKDFDISTSQKFDKDNFVTFYGNLNPRALFVTNGLKIISMGGEANIDMQRLGSALIHLKKKNFDEFIEVMYEIYHTLNSLEVENINEKTYEDNFKTLVEKYVKINVKQNKNKTKIVEDFREVIVEGDETK